VVLVGKCEPTPTGVVAGITTILLMPKKLVPVMLGPWQLTQPLVIPLWLNAELVNLAPLATGSCKLELAPTWQLSQAVVPNGTCLAGGATMVKAAAGIAKVAAFVVLWHCAQLVVVDGALAWISATVGITEKSGLVWHDVQVAVAEVGM
jgi:hypothetical protein